MHQAQIPEEDFTLSAIQLDAKYNPEGGGQHPAFTRRDWRNAVANEDTTVGYWQWLEDQLFELQEDREE